jgi:hypothetical protein
MHILCEVHGMKNTLIDQAVQLTTNEKKPSADSPTANETCSDIAGKGLKVDRMLYCLDTGKEKYLFTSMDEAIDQLRKLDKKSINPDNSQIAEVMTTGNTWKLTPVPWSHIAVKLL